MDTKNEIPAADPNAGYRIRLDRALDELEAVLSSQGGDKRPTMDQSERLRRIVIAWSPKP